MPVSSKKIVEQFREKQASKLFNTRLANRSAKPLETMHDWRSNQQPRQIQRTRLDEVVNTFSDIFFTTQLKKSGKHLDDLTPKELTDMARKSADACRAIADQIPDPNDLNNPNHELFEYLMPKLSQSYEVIAATMDYLNDEAYAQNPSAPRPSATPAARDNSDDEKVRLGLDQNQDEDLGDRSATLATGVTSFALRHNDDETENLIKYMKNDREQEQKQSLSGTPQLVPPIGA